MNVLKELFLLIWDFIRGILGYRDVLPDEVGIVVNGKNIKVPYNYVFKTPSGYKEAYELRTNDVFLFDGLAFTVIEIVLDDDRDWQDIGELTNDTCYS